MDWTRRQGHILTGDGRLEKLYKRTDFEPQELPHYHKRKGDTWEVFEKWQQSPATASTAASVAGAWCRPLFVGGWEHSDSTQESVINLQTPSIFIDMRVPNNVEFPDARCLQDLSMEQLRLFARRHAFAGITRVESINGTPVATRHHAIDWNFVGRMRARPNKWRIEMRGDGEVWKEWGVARDEQQQHIYMERWERLTGGAGPFLALRRFPGTASGGCSRDAFLLVCGNHFAYIEDRLPSEVLNGMGRTDVSQYGSLVELVDAAVANGDRHTAEAYLDLTACHGLCAGDKAWVIDYALQPWLIGTTLMEPCELQLCMEAHVRPQFKWRGASWAVLECTFTQDQLFDLSSGCRPKLQARL